MLSRLNRFLNPFYVLPYAPDEKKQGEDKAKDFKVYSRFMHRNIKERIEDTYVVIRGYERVVMPGYWRMVAGNPLTLLSFGQAMEGLGASFETPPGIFDWLTLYSFRLLHAITRGVTKAAEICFLVARHDASEHDGWDYARRVLLKAAAGVVGTVLGAVAIPFIVLDIICNELIRSATAAIITGISLLFTAIAHGVANLFLNKKSEAWSSAFEKNYTDQGKKLMLALNGNKLSLSTADIVVKKTKENKQVTVEFHKPNHEWSSEALYSFQSDANAKLLDDLAEINPDARRALGHEMVWSRG